MKKLPTLLTLLTLLAAACSHEPAGPTAAWRVSGDEPDGVTYAAGYVIYDLARSRSPAMRAIRDRCRDAMTFSNPCDDGGGSMEAIIGVLGAGGDATTEGLLKMMALELDAGLGEGRECEISRRGKALLPALRNLNANEAATWCESEFKALSKRQLSDVTDVPVSKICRAPAEIESDRLDWIKAFETGQEGCSYE